MLCIYAYGSGFQIHELPASQISSRMTKAEISLKKLPSIQWSSRLYRVFVWGLLHILLWSHGIFLLFLLPTLNLKKYEKIGHFKIGALKTISVT